MASFFLLIIFPDSHFMFAILPKSTYICPFTHDLTSGIKDYIYAHTGIYPLIC